DPASCKRGDRLGNRHQALLAHRIETNLTRWHRDRMTVLNPKDDPLVGAGRREARVAIRGPRVGVMGGRERAIDTAAIVGGGSSACIAERIERVFDDVVPGCADDVEKQLTAEFGKAEAVADFAAIEDDCTSSRSAALGPLGEDLAIRGE